MVRNFLLFEILVIWKYTIYCIRLQINKTCVICHGRKKFFWRPKNTFFSFHIALIECISLGFRVLLGPCQFTQVGPGKNSGTG